MKFKIDENLPAEVAELLRTSGFDAMTVFDQKLVGEPDELILSVCQAEERVLITVDMDFSDIRVCPPEEHFGLIVLRSRQQDKHSLLEQTKKLIPAFKSESPVGNLWIVDGNRIRIRGGSA
ncbi:MAG: DUF5615 family PIN-like protein [Acidobacteria bacterium]|nr:DUF5615 family PIN-like protein [Acidobacteriota bacterium]